jgi:2-methylcitrate dehydratase PrpD
MQIVDLWNQYSSLTWREIPESTQQVTRQCLMDWLGCTLAGSREPLAEILHDEYRSQTGVCSVVGSDLRLPPQVAAFINGCEGHALDFDDTSTVMGGHPSAPVIPAVLAEAEERECSGEEVLAAIVVGIEIASRLGILIGGDHYARGWHVTSTMGVFGAAAGVAHLLKLGTEEFGYAMGLAASQASGLKANFGTMTKPFHAGHAAERGLLSARLGARGFTSNPDSFAGNQGLSSAASIGALSETRYAHYKDQWLTEHVLFKYHAACYLTHASIECLLALGNVTDDCETITITVNPSLLDVCGIENPVSGLETKFSLRATSALTVLGHDTTDPETYSDSLFEDESINQMIDRVSVETDESLKTTQSRVQVLTSKEASHETFYDTGIPASDLDRQQQKLESKFQNLVASIGLNDNLLNRVDSFEKLKNIRGWLG